MDPTSETAREILRDGLHLSAEQHQQLAKLAVLINDWNGRVNLISRRDCSRDVVFGRHILPSLAPLAVLSNGAPRDGAAGGDDDDDDDAPPLQFAPGQLVCDVGTGGGLPGLPLAIARPDLQFTLVDSVGKKIVAVRDMADRLGLTNVRTVHGRAEDLTDGRHGFDWVVGRSVAAIPTYALWIQHLLKTGTDGGGGGGGHLVYLVGGEIEEEILDRAVVDEGIGTLLGRPDVSDKRVLIFPEPAVRGLALESRETLRVPRRGGGAGPARSAASDASRPPRQKANTPRGQWTKRESATPKRRGYENFQRFDSLSKRPTD